MSIPRSFGIARHILALKPICVKRRAAPVLLVVCSLFYLTYHLMLRICDTDRSPAERGSDAFYLHYVRFASNPTKNLSFTDYLSILSGVQYLRPDEILLHGDRIPTGPYWDNLTAKHLIKFIPMEPPTDFGSAGGKPKKPSFLEHAADVAKLNILLKYGGVAVDFDVFFVHGERIKEILKSKKAITCYSDEESYCIGFLAGHKDSHFLKAWRRSYTDIYVENDWGFNQGYVSRYLSALFAQEVYVANHICVPYVPEYAENAYYYRNTMAMHTYEGGRTDRVESIEDLVNANTTARTEMFRNIYFHINLPPADRFFIDEVLPEPY
ncbi:hypothetical protein RvY_03124 [Ramazzottius varieornatus]|uniref:Alpha-1,4-N-acetylglucosaminyltransferase n=1 Tax=Ramazzottius varieornatus TaxID=947166 RepID=A0A1D1ULY7_RAMVA|nr:hypothetical protein RvY_03124 [Ramazzottius varieornatus]